MNIKSTFLKGSIIALLTFYSVNSLQAQKRFDEIMMTDLGGKPVYLKTEYLREGSPYLPEEYSRSVVILKSGKAYPDINSRMNLYDNLLLVLRDDGTELTLMGNISKVIYEFVPTENGSRRAVFQKGFPSVNGLDSTTFYEVLDSGKLTLIKHYKVTYTDRKGYGEADVTRTFIKKESYYIVLPGNTIRPLEKGKEEFLSALPGKKNELEKYIDNNKLKCKKEEDWITLVAYYNSLER